MLPSPSKSIGVRNFIRWCILALRIFVYLAPVVLIPFNLYYIFIPGPVIYYNNFPALILGSCLLFTSTQLFFLRIGTTTYTRSVWRRLATRSYWAVVTLTAVTCALCYGIVRKYDCFGICVITLLTCALTASRLDELSYLHLRMRRLGTRNSIQPSTEIRVKNESRADSFDPFQKSTHSHSHSRVTVLTSLDLGSTLQIPDEDDEHEIPWWRSDRGAWRTVTIMSRPLRALHSIAEVISLPNSPNSVLSSHLALAGIVPAAPTLYYPETGLGIWRAQKLQDAILARQYYQLLAATKADSEDPYLNATQLPSTMPFRAILSTQSRNVTIQDYWRRQKLSVIESLGGPGLAPIEWCWDCSPNFPIEQAKYTADTIARIVGGAVI